MVREMGDGIHLLRYPTLFWVLPSRSDAGCGGGDHANDHDGYLAVAIGLSWPALPTPGRAGSGEQDPNPFAGHPLNAVMVILLGLFRVAHWDYSCFVLTVHFAQHGGNRTCLAGRDFSRMMPRCNAQLSLIFCRFNAIFRGAGDAAIAKCGRAGLAKRDSLFCLVPVWSCPALARAVG